MRAGLAQHQILTTKHTTMGLHPRIKLSS